MSTIHHTAVVHPTATIDPTATLGAQAIVGSGATIGAHARIGERAILWRNASVGDFATIEDDAVVGEDTEIGAGAKLAAHAKMHTAGEPSITAALAPLVEHGLLDTDSVVMMGDSKDALMKPDPEDDTKMVNLTEPTEDDEEMGKATVSYKVTPDDLAATFTVMGDPRDTCR